MSDLLRRAQSHSGLKASVSEMGLLIRVFVPLVLICCGGRLQDGPTAKAVHPHTASVSGRVTISNAPAVGVQVALLRSDNSPEDENKIYRTKTDQDGHYLLDSLTSGYYTVQVVEPTMVLARVRKPIS